MEATRKARRKLTFVGFAHDRENAENILSWTIEGEHDVNVRLRDCSVFKLQSAEYNKKIRITIEWDAKELGVR